MCIAVRFGENSRFFFRGRVLPQEFSRRAHELLRVTYQYFGRFLFIYLMDSDESAGHGARPLCNGERESERVRKWRVANAILHRAPAVSFRSVFTGSFSVFNIRSVRSRAQRDACTVAAASGRRKLITGEKAGWRGGESY